MEGAGEGIVAVVRGLRDAGLAVTLVGARAAPDRAVLRQSSPVLPAKSTVETSTSALPAATSVDTAAQICDDRYTSSYQLAHCSARPSSPPVELSEFPPQRSEPCRTQGNFEIGIGSGESKAPINISISRSPHRSSFTCVDRGLLTRNHSSRATQSFAHSLRKYPSISPYRSVSPLSITPGNSISTELVQRLLAYTQAKNFSKSSYHSKSLRSLRSKTESPKDIPKVNSSKSVQTYTRNKTKEKLPKEREGTGSKKEFTKRKRAQSPVKSLRDIRHKDPINTTYDYLKSASIRRFRAADVRYLSDMTRCLRDTLRQICEDQPVMCPNIQNRYSRHRREHHRQASMDSNNVDQELSPMGSPGGLTASVCEATPGTYQSCPLRPKICCYCRKPIPCTCAPRSSVQFQDYPNVITREPSTESDNCMRPVGKNDKCICSEMSEDDFGSRVKEEVYKWLQEIPVYANDTPEDRKVRENMAEGLVQKLKSLKDEEDFEEKAKDEIATCVNNMPMWCPGDEDGQELFKQQIAGNLLDKFKEVFKRVDNFEKEISKWIASINLNPKDSKGKVVDKKNVVDNLVNRLKPLALNRAGDSGDYKEALKAEIVDTLEEIPIKVEGDKKTYINKVADKLATQLHTIPAKDIFKRTSVGSLEDENQKQIWEWLADVPEFSNISGPKLGETQKSVKLLANKLQKIQTKGIEDTGVQGQMQSEIDEWIDKNVGKKSRLDSITKSELSEKLLEKLIRVTKSAAKNKSKKPLSVDALTQRILEWLDDIPELAGGNKLETQKMVEKLAKKLFELRNQGKDDSELKDEIIDYLITAFENKGVRLDSKNQDNLVNKLLSKIKTLSDVKENDQLDQEIWDCLKNISGLDVPFKDTKKLANKIQDLQSQNQGVIDEGEIKDEIENWLNDVIKEKGANVSLKTKNQLVQELTNIAMSLPKQRKRWSKQDNLQQVISDALSDIFQTNSLNITNGKKKDLQDKITNLLCRNMSKVKSSDGCDEIKSKIVDVLEEEAQMPTAKARKMASDIINKIQNTTLPEPGISSNGLVDTLREEVGLILDDSHIHCDNRDEIDSKLADVLADQVMRGENNKQTKNRVVNILVDSDVPKDQANDIADKLTDMSREVSLSQKTKDYSTARLSNMSKSNRFETLSPIQKQVFKDTAEQEIVDFIKDITGDSSVLATKKYKAAADKLAQRVSDIMSDKDTTIDDKREDIENEIGKCLQSLSIKSDESQTNELADKLQNLAFRTSTPKRSSFERNMSFRPRRDSGGSTMSDIDDSQFKMQAPTPSEEEKQYMSKLVDIIESWMSALPINLDTGDEKGLKNVMTRDLAGDIIDRQKYLQLNPDAKTSDEEELEHLKYQVFRWLHKLTDVKELMPSISKTDDLMERIKGLSVPQLIKAIDKRSIRRLSQNISSLQNEISKWIDAVPSKFYACSNKDHRARMVNDLAQQIDRLHREEALTESSLDNIVSNWLVKILKEYSEQYFSSLTEGLKGQLVNQGLVSLIEASNLAQQSSRVIQDNLNTFILDWLKEKPLYQKRPSKDKREQEQIVAELSKNLKDALKSSYPTESHRDERMIDEIKSHLKKFPMESHLKSDEEFHHSNANDLLEYLKMLQMFENSSESKSQRESQGDLKSCILDWLKEKPLYQKRLSTDKREQEQIVAELSKNLKDALKVPYKSESHRDERVLNEIKSHLKKFPMESHLKSDEEFHHSTANDLLEYLKMLQMFENSSESKTQRESLGDLKSCILNWLKEKPLYQKRLSRDKREQEEIVEELSKNLKDALKAPYKSESHRDQRVLDEIKWHLKKFPVESHLKSDEEFHHSTANDLLEYLKMLQMFQNVSESQSQRDSLDNLKCYILDWLKEKPLYRKRLSRDKKEQEQIVAELSKNLRDALKVSYQSESHRDERVLDEIKSHLKKFPMDSHLKLNEEFHHSTANDLLEYLKMQEMFQDMENLRSQTESALGPSVSTLFGGQDILPILEEWIDSLTLQVRQKSVENKKLENLKKEFAKTLHQLKERNPAPSKRTSASLREEINKYMQLLPIDPAKKKDEEFVNNKIDELHNKLLALQSELSSSGKTSISVDGLKNIIQNWGKTLPFQSGKSIEKSKSEVDKVAAIIKDILSKAPMTGFEKCKPNLEKEIKSFVNKLPLQKKKNTSEHITSLMNELGDFVKTSTASRPSMTTDSSYSAKSYSKKAADVLYDNVKDWCENLPIPPGKTPEEKENVKSLKQDIANKLFNVIGDLNMNPEIFNDDVLYEELLNDEIDNLISTLPPNPQLKSNLPALKENLIEKIKEAKLITQDELAGQAYKQQLRDAISRTLPSIDDLSIEDQAPFEVLKDNLADAYINLHHAAADDEMKSKFKEKIRDEINKYCNDYLERYPALPVDPKKLNRELYNVLQKVPAPKDETIKSQIEQVRIKNEINDWLKDVPLKDCESSAEQLQRNKIVSVLAKRLHDIEKEKELNPDIDVEDRMQKEIYKWIKKLPIQPGQEDAVEEMVSQLTSRLKDTEESRRFSISNIRHSFDTADEPWEPVCPIRCTQAKQIPSPTDNIHLSRFDAPFPPSTLSTEDRAHLERIRARNQQLSFMPVPPCYCKDASVNPIPIDEGSQTDIGPCVRPGSAKSMRPQPTSCYGGQSPQSQTSDYTPYSQGPVSPQVLVKEYFWDSPESKTREPYGPQGPSVCSGQNQPTRGQQLPQPCGQPAFGQRPQPPQQYSWPQPQANLPPRFGPAQPQSPCSSPQGFPTPDQTRMPHGPNVLSPSMPQPAYMPQHPRQPSPCMSPMPPSSSQLPYMPPSPHMPPCISQPQMRPGQSPCTPQRPYPSAPPMPQPYMMPRQSPMPQPSMMPSSPEMRSYTNQHQPPCMSTPRVSQPQMPPYLPPEPPRQRHIPPCRSQETRRKPTRQPCFGSPEISSTSSPFDTGPDADNGFSPKVTRLGSLDDVPCTRTCGSQSPKAKRSRACPDEEFEWKIGFPEDDGFWGTACPRRRVHAHSRSPNRGSERFVKEKERKEEQTRCRCRERVITKCMGRRPQTCNHPCQQDDDTMSHCSKCCGAHCPHPSYLYFR